MPYASDRKEEHKSAFRFAVDLIMGQTKQLFIALFISRCDVPEQNSPMGGEADFIQNVISYMC